MNEVGRGIVGDVMILALVARVVLSYPDGGSGKRRALVCFV